MSTVTKGTSSRAFRYFVFILFVCVFLFVFLVSRLVAQETPRTFEEIPLSRIYISEVQQPYSFINASLNTCAGCKAVRPVPSLI